MARGLKQAGDALKISQKNSVTQEEEEARVTRNFSLKLHFSKALIQRVKITLDGTTGGNENDILISRILGIFKLSSTTCFVQGVASLALDGFSYSRAESYTFYFRALLILEESEVCPPPRTLRAMSLIPALR